MSRLPVQQLLFRWDVPFVWAGVQAGRIVQYKWEIAWKSEEYANYGQDKNFLALNFWKVFSRMDS